MVDATFYDTFEGKSLNNCHPLCLLYCVFLVLRELFVFFPFRKATTVYCHIFELLRHF